MGYEPISSRVVDEQPWLRAVAFDEEQRRWSAEQCLQRYRKAQVHSSTVDAIALHCTRSGTRLAVSGSRDRSLVLWNIGAIESNEAPNTEWHKLVGEAHNVGFLTLLVLSQISPTLDMGMDGCCC